VILGRLCAVVAIGSLAFVESYVVGVVVFGASLPIHHPAEFALALLGVLVAILGTACLLAPLFVLSRVTVMFEVLLTYPFYILGAVLFPVELLPHWLRPVSDLVFLRWGADLLRSTAAPGPVHEYAARLLLVVGFGVASYALGSWLTARAVATVKVRGTAVLA
jgi:ABC-2 type transport system permease protein